MQCSSWPPALQNGGPRFLAQFLERLQAVADEAGAGDVDPAHALLRQRDQRRLRYTGSSHRARPNRDWNETAYCSRSESELAGEQRVRVFWQ